MNHYIFEIAYYWITQAVIPRSDIDYGILKEKIIQNAGKLPEILSDNTSHMKIAINETAAEILGKIEYSSPAKYFILNKGRKISSILRMLFRIMGIIFFIVFQILIRAIDNPAIEFLFFGLSLLFFLASFLCNKLSDRIFSIILKNLKPGDYLRIISEPDELVEKTIILNPLNNDATIFNKGTTFYSKKRLICENLVSQIPRIKPTIKNKFIIYIVIDYLKSVYAQEAYREYLLEKEIDALEYICAFSPDYIPPRYELALLYSESNQFQKFYETLLDCRSLGGYDIGIESLIKAYEFTMEVEKKDL